jgi:endonuclease/exonuclease/phosphatase (EEP) superfamily protein YafD
MKRYWRIATIAGVWSYVALVVVLFLLLWLAADRWWLATLALFGPLTLILFPLLLLFPAAFFQQRILLLPLAVAALLLVFGVLDFRLHWNPAFRKSDKSLRVLTLNVGPPDLDAATCRMLIEKYQPDVIVLQEKDSADAFKGLQGWNTLQREHLAVVSHFPLREVGFTQRDNPPAHWTQVNALAADMETPQGTIRVCTVHLRTPRNGISEVLSRRTIIAPWRSAALEAEIDIRDQECRNVSGWLRSMPSTDFIAGDFNMPVGSHIYRRYWSIYDNAFSLAGFGFGLSKVSRVAGIRFGSRIDHILFSDRWQVINCRVGADMGSDHRPVIADLALRD